MILGTLATFLAEGKIKVYQPTPNKCLHNVLQSALCEKVEELQYIRE